VALDDASVTRILRLCDLACQRSGLRFRAARVALNDERDSLLRAVAAAVFAAASPTAADPAAVPGTPSAAVQAVAS